MGLKKTLLLATLALFLPGASAFSQDMNSNNNPLFGTWTLSQKGYGGCAEKRTFAENVQTWYINGQVVNAPATYSMSGNIVYVQQHIGSGGTVGFVILSENEIMDTLGYNACHWTRQ